MKIDYKKKKRKNDGLSQTFSEQEDLIMVFIFTSYQEHRLR
jgi:hypothetical protein